MKKIIGGVFLSCIVSSTCFAAGGYIGYAENASGLTQGSTVSVRVDDGCELDTVLKYYAPRKTGYVGWRLEISTATCSGVTTKKSGYAPVGGPILQEQLLTFVLD